MKMISISMLIILTASVSFGQNKEEIDKENCTFNNFRLYGKIQFVESFPDITVKVVESFPEIEIRSPMELFNE